MPHQHSLTSRLEQRATAAVNKAADRSGPLGWLGRTARSAQQIRAWDAFVADAASDSVRWSTGLRDLLRRDPDPTAAARFERGKALLGRVRVAAWATGAPLAGAATVLFLLGSA